MDTTPFHICIISQGYPSENNPYYTFVGQLCETLSSINGVRITVIVPLSITKTIFRRHPYMPSYRVIYTNKGHQIEIYQPHFFSVGNFNIFGEKFNFVNFNKSIKKCCLKYRIKPHVFYGHFWKSGYSVYELAKKKNIPLFIASGESEICIQHNLEDRSLKDFASYVKGVICVSSKNKKESIEKCFVEASKCIVLPNAVDFSKFYLKDKKKLRKQKSIAENDFIIIFVGGFIHRKGSNRVIQALNILNDVSIKSIFIGDHMGVKKNEPISDCVIFSGRVSHENLIDYLNCADVFVLPTLHEGCCNSILEAMACGLPIISSNLDFNDDILSEEYSIRIDPLNIVQIADAISLLKKNEPLREKMSKAAVNAIKNFSIEDRANNILDFIFERIIITK